MEKKTIRILVSIVMEIFLLAACVPAQAAVQEAALEQQVRELSAALTRAAQPQDPRVLQLQQTVDSLLAVQATASATLDVQQVENTVSPSPGVILDFDLQKIIDASATAKEFEFQQSIRETSTALNAPTATDIPYYTETPAPTDTSYPLYITATQDFKSCNLFLSDNAYSLPTRLPLQDLVRGDSVLIINPVNLRTGPALSYTVMMTLNPDPNTTFTIVGGPAYTNFTNDEDLGVEDAPYIVTNRKYKWWLIQFPDRTTTGWVAEASACGDYYHILEKPPAS